jgi:hypothetical protein
MDYGDDDMVVKSLDVDVVFLEKVEVGTGLN